MKILKKLRMMRSKIRKIKNKLKLAKFKTRIKFKLNKKVLMEKIKK